MPTKEEFHRATSHMPETISRRYEPISQKTTPLDLHFLIGFRSVLNAEAELLVVLQGRPRINRIADAVKATLRAGQRPGLDGIGFQVGSGGALMRPQPRDEHRVVVRVALVGPPAYERYALPGVCCAS